MADVLLGAVFGLLIAIAIWWVQYRVLVPKIGFSEGISRLGDDGGSVYRFKLENQGRRGIIDLTLDVVVGLGKGVIAYRETALSNTSQSIRVEMRGDRIARLKPDQNRIRRLDLRPATWEGVNRRLLDVVGVDPNAGAEVELEQLLASTASAYLQIRVLAYDEISGSRKYFESPRYRLANVRYGPFSKLALSGPATTYAGEAEEKTPHE